MQTISFLRVSLGDFHTHNKYCRHASGNLIDYVRAAISKGLPALGFCDHFPMCFLPKQTEMAQYAMTLEDIPIYLQKCQELKSRFSDQLEIFVGYEVDYYKPSFSKYQQTLDPIYDKVDYLIGSIHILEWDGQDVWGVIDTTGPAKVKELGLEKVMIEYFNTMISLIKSEYFQIVGHMDLPKKYSPERFETNPNIWEKVLDVLDIIEQSEMALEINTSGFYKGAGEQYTSDLIMEEAINRKIPITIGSDAHRPEDVGYKFDEILMKLKKFGLKEVIHWQNRQKIKKKIA
jgi:histidinol-phosphatase (PHP family)